MARRHRMGNRKSKGMFIRNALKVHPFNSGVMTGPGGPMRGGIRL